MFLRLLHNPVRLIRFTGGKNKSNEEFLMANRTMGILPATCSMIATYISAILVLGTPAEVCLCAKIDGKGRPGRQPLDSVITKIWSQMQ